MKLFLLHFQTIQEKSNEHHTFILRTNRQKRKSYCWQHGSSKGNRLTALPIKKKPSADMRKGSQ